MYAPGKWTAREILLHLTHVELVDGVRLRMALSEPGYVVQPFDPEEWMRVERSPTGPQIVSCHQLLRRLNLALWDAVPLSRWERPFGHPECGTMTLRDLAAIWAGHELHHLAQLRAIGAVGGKRPR
jgi:hypothetical protein